MYKGSRCRKLCVEGGSYVLPNFFHVYNMEKGCFVVSHIFRGIRSFSKKIYGWLCKFKLNSRKQTLFNQDSGGTLKIVKRNAEQ